MSKTKVSDMITKIKRRVDYDISDSDLDTLLLDMINDAVKVIGQWHYDRDILMDITQSTSFQTIPGQEYRDPRVAVIVGDTSSFTGIAGDTIDLNVDGTDYADIDISSATDIDDVVTAINTAVGSTVASNNSTSGTLQISSLTSGSTSTVTISDGTSTAQTVVGDLFSESDDRTATGITDIEDIVQITERDNETAPYIIPYDKFKILYPKPSSNSSTSCDHVSLFNNRIYFGPRPSSYIRYYIDYKKYSADLANTDSLPFHNKFDPLVIACVRVEYLQFFDARDVQTIAVAKQVQSDLYNNLILGATNRAEINQSESRNATDVTGPQAPDTGNFT